MVELLRLEHLQAACGRERLDRAGRDAQAAAGRTIRLGEDQRYGVRAAEDPAERALGEFRSSRED
jgi:hypothetical protein